MTFFAADDRPIRRDSREKKTRSGRLFLAPQEEAYKSATGSAFYPYALYAVFLGNKTEGNICIRPFAFKREKGAGLRTRTDQKRIGRDRKVPKASRRGLRRKFRRRSSGKGLFVRRKKEKYVFIRNALSYRVGERVQPPFARGNGGTVPLQRLFGHFRHRSFSQREHHGGQKAAFRKSRGKILRGF